MRPVAYQIVVRDPGGMAIGNIAEFVALDYARREKNVGTLELELDADKFDASMFPIDARLEVWRGDGGATALDMETCWFVRRRTRRTDNQGIQTLRILAVDAIDLLRRRIVAYAAGSSYANKTNQLDDMVKDIVRENLGASCVDVTRKWDAYISVAADLSAAPSKTKAYSRDNVLDVLGKLADVSYEAGTYLAYDFIYDPNATVPFIFRTFTGQRGVDARWPSATRPVLLSVEAGNMADALLEDDYLEEVTYVYAGGQGEGDARAIATATDATRSAISPFGRSEAFVDARLTTTTNELQSEADAELTAGQPHRRFTARLVDCEGTRYGTHYGYGDYVTAQFGGELFDVRISAVRVSVADETETIDARLEYLS